MKQLAGLVFALTALAAEVRGQCTVVSHSFAGLDIKQECVLNSARNSYVILVEQKHNVNWGLMTSELARVLGGGECSGAPGTVTVSTDGEDLSIETFVKP